MSAVGSKWAASPDLRMKRITMCTVRTTYAQRLNGKIIRLGGFDGTKSWRVGPDGKVQTVEDPAQLRKTRRDIISAAQAITSPNDSPRPSSSLRQ